MLSTIGPTVGPLTTMLVNAGCGLRLIAGNVNLHVTPGLADVSSRLIAPIRPVVFRVVAAKVGATAVIATTAAAQPERARRTMPVRDERAIGNTRNMVNPLRSLRSE